MRAQLDARAAELMAANPGWVVLSDDRFLVLLALPGHLREAFWICDTDPNRLAARMSKVESLLRTEAQDPPAGRTTRRPQRGSEGRASAHEAPRPARPAARRKQVKR